MFVTYVWLLSNRLSKFRTVRGPNIAPDRSSINRKLVTNIGVAPNLGSGPVLIPQVRREANLGCSCRDRSRDDPNVLVETTGRLYPQGLIWCLAPRGGADTSVPGLVVATWGLDS